MPIAIAPFSGLGLLPDSDLALAQSYLAQAGYSGSQCFTQRVPLPMPDPATGLSYYDQQVCSTPGYLGSNQVSAVLNSTAAHPGYGVDLTAERLYLNRQGDGPGTGQSYLEAFGTEGGATVRSLTAPLEGSQPVRPSTVPATSAYPLPNSNQAVIPQSTAFPTDLPSSLTGPLDFGDEGSFSLSPLVLIAGAALLFFMMGKK